MIMSRDLYTEPRPILLTGRSQRTEPQQSRPESLTIRRRVFREWGTTQATVKLEAVLDATGEVIRAESYTTHNVYMGSFVREKTVEFRVDLESAGYKITEIKEN
jgi:hypothetical protein